MKISELQAQLEALKEEEGDLPVMIERPSGIFVNIEEIYKTYILNNIVKFDEGGAILSGHDHVVIKAYV